MAVNVTARERRLLGIIGMIVGALLIVAVPLGLELLIGTRQTDNADLRAALSDVQEARAKVREWQAKKDAIAHRYSKKPAALAGFIEQAAKSQKLEVTDSVDRPEVPHGKRYVERNTMVHLKKAGLLPISRFVESMEKSGNAIAVTRFNIRKRSGEQDSYDVEIGVSAYDRNEPAPSSSGAAPATSGSAKP